MSSSSKPYTAFVGIDRSDAKLDIAVSKGGAISEKQVSTKPEAILDWVHELRSTHRRGRIAICIEQPCANIAILLNQFDFIDLFLINPASLKRYRESFHLARAKDDRKDSRCLAEFVVERHCRLKPWKPDQPLARELRLLVERRRTLVDDRTRLVNRLTAELKLYFPHALELTGKDLHATLACNFLLKWPNLGQLKSAGRSAIVQFYRRHGSCRPKLLEQRLQVIDDAVPLTEDPALIAPCSEMALCLVGQLNLLRSQIAAFEERIESIMAKHEDAPIFESLPGAGPVLASRLAATLGTDRDRYEGAPSLQCFTGIAPVTKSSGKSRHIHRRYAKYTCPHFEHQSFIEWVKQTIPRSLWAKAYYLHQRAKGAGQYTAIRALAYKWQRILFRCWKNRTPYDEAHYLKALKRSGSPLVKKIEELKQELAQKAAAQ